MFPARGGKKKEEVRDYADVLRLYAHREEESSVSTTTPSADERGKSVQLSLQFPEDRHNKEGGNLGGLL